MQAQVKTLSSYFFWLAYPFSRGSLSGNIGTNWIDESLIWKHLQRYRNGRYHRVADFTGYDFNTTYQTSGKSSKSWFPQIVKPYDPTSRVQLRFRLYRGRLLWRRTYLKTLDEINKVQTILEISDVRIFAGKTFFGGGGPSDQILRLYSEDFFFFFPFSEDIFSLSSKLFWRVFC